MDETKGKIVEAATKLFAEKGLDGVTVREICAAAGVNVALVNYHFKSKEGLYAVCIERLFARIGGERIATLDKDVTDEAGWRRAVTEWVKGFSRVLHDQSAAYSSAAWAFRQEVIKPSAMYETLKDNFGLPVFNCLKNLLMMAVSTEREALLWMTSIWAQLSASVLVDRRWQDVFRPRGEGRAKWGREFADFVLNTIFRELNYRG